MNIKERFTTLINKYQPIITEYSSKTLEFISEQSTQVYQSDHYFKIMFVIICLTSFIFGDIYQRLFGSNQISNVNEIIDEIKINQKSQLLNVQIYEKRARYLSYFQKFVVLGIIGFSCVIYFFDVLSDSKVYNYSSKVVILISLFILLFMIFSIKSLQNRFLKREREKVHQNQQSIQQIVEQFLKQLNPELQNIVQREIQKQEKTKIIGQINEQKIVLNGLKESLSTEKAQLNFTQQEKYKYIDMLGYKSKELQLYNWFHTQLKKISVFCPICIEGKNNLECGCFDLYKLKCAGLYEELNRRQEKLHQEEIVIKQKHPTFEEF